MSDTTAHSGAICPGQRTLLPGHHPRYLRFVFDTDWMGASPSPVVFYLHKHPVDFSYTGIEKLKAEVTERIRANGGDRLVKVEYLTYGPIEMTDDDIAAVGWHFICGSDDGAGDPPAPIPAPAPDPAPEPPQPVPPAVPEPAPMPDPAPEPVPAPVEPSTEPPATPEPPPAPSPADTVPDDHPHPLDVTLELTDEQKAEIVRWLPSYLRQLVDTYNVERKASAIRPWLEGHSTVEDRTSARNAIEPILGGSPPDDLYQIAVTFCCKSISRQPGYVA